MTKRTLIWMILSSWITCHVFFALNYNEYTQTYFGRFPDWIGYIIYFGYFFIGGLMLWQEEEDARKEKLARAK